LSGFTAEDPGSIEMEVGVWAKIVVASIDRETSPTASAVRRSVVDILLIIHQIQQGL
jgi:hypothetical protein